MAVKQQRDMSGVLFKNDRKEQPNHPDYKGNARINGVDYWLSAWIKEGDQGKFMSLALKPKEAERPTTSQRGSARTEDAEDIPF